MTAIPGFAQVAVDNGPTFPVAKEKCKLLGLAWLFALFGNVHLNYVEQEATVIVTDAPQVQPQANSG